MDEIEHFQYIIEDMNHLLELIYAHFITQNNFIVRHFPKTVGPSVLTDRHAVGQTISKYISDRMSGKT
jgi:hypothetical protein